MSSVNINRKELCTLPARMVCAGRLEGFSSVTIFERGNPVFKVHIGHTPKGRDKWAKFSSLESAASFCNEVFAKTGKVLTIIQGRD